MMRKYYQNFIKEKKTKLTHNLLFKDILLNHKTIVHIIDKIIFKIIEITCHLE